MLFIWFLIAVPSQDCLTTYNARLAVNLVATESAEAKNSGLIELPKPETLIQVVTSSSTDVPPLPESFKNPCYDIFYKNLDLNKMP